MEKKKKTKEKTKQQREKFIQSSCAIICFPSSCSWSHHKFNRLNSSLQCCHILAYRFSELWPLVCTILLFLSGKMDEGENDMAENKEETMWWLKQHAISTQGWKNLKQKFILQLNTLNPHEINERLSFHYLFTNSWDPISTNAKAPPHFHINLQHPTQHLTISSVHSDEGLTLEMSGF